MFSFKTEGQIPSIQYRLIISILTLPVTVWARIPSHTRWSVWCYKQWNLVLCWVVLWLSWKGQFH